MAPSKRETAMQGPTLLRSALDWVNRAPPGADNALRRLYAIARFALPMGLGVHLFYSVVFFYLGQSVMAWYNLAIVPVWVFAVWSAATLRSLELPLLLAALIETVLHGLLATLFMGLAPFFLAYNLFAIILPPVFPFWSRPTRIAISVGVALVTVVTGALAVVTEPSQPLAQGWNLFFFIQNATATFIFLSLMLALLEYAVDVAETGLTREYDRAEGLLRNILPDAIATRLKDDADRLIADDHPTVSVVFADIVGFTRTSASLPPAQLVALLDTLFRSFDDLAERHGCEKIKTIGDAYMAAAGLPEPRGDHAAAAVSLGLDMMDAAAMVAAGTGIPVALRVGVNSGPVVAGVIGNRKFAYDLWGDTVNVAARMEEQASPGSLYVTASTRAGLDAAFDCRPLGSVAVRGRGAVEAFAVTRAETRDGLSS